MGGPMRQTFHIGKTYKEDPKDTQTVAHKLLLRAGYIQQIAAGVYVFMPLLLRTLRKLSQIIRSEMNAGGFVELLLPTLQPKSLWIESGRWNDDNEIGRSIFVVRDHRGGSFCLAQAHEEVITDIIRKEVHSYKHLPKKVYQIQTTFSDDTRPRSGLIHARESMVTDAYSYHANEADLDACYQAVLDAYHRICTCVDLDFRCVEGDNSANGGISRHEFIVLTETGEDTIVYCDTCNYAANQKIAESSLAVFPQDTKEKAREAVYGPGLIGVEPLAEFLNLPVWKTTKTLLFQADSKVVAVMVRGDCDVNALKVKKFLKCNELSLASPEVITELTGAKVGYAGPIDLPPEIDVIADHFTKERVNFECGANKTDYHYINVNFERDLPLPVFGDFKLAKQDHFCPRCKNGTLKEAQGIDVGHVMKLGAEYSKKMNATYQAADGKYLPMLMGSHQFSISRLAAAVVEQHNDPSGIIWPARIAPFQVHLIGLNLETDDVRTEAERIYSTLRQENIEVLFDDRNVRAGEKFGDADLFGIPIRLTISKRTCKAQGIELKLRNNPDSQHVSYDDALKKIHTFYKIPVGSGASMY